MSETIKDWFDGEGSCERTFFEFTLSQKDGRRTLEDAFKGVDLVASKEYTPAGVIVITLWFQGQIYAILGEGTKENPLLDSRFPDISKKGKGYQIKTLSDGLPNWPELRKISIWQTLAGAKLEGEEQRNNSDGNTALETETTDSKGGRKRMVELESKNGNGDEKREAKNSGDTDDDIDSLAEADSKSEDEILIHGRRSSGSKDAWIDDYFASVNDNGSDAKLIRSGSGQDEGDKDWGDDEKAAKITTVSNSSSKKASGGLEGRLAQMRMDMASSVEDYEEAPWDEFGRPRMAPRKTRKGSPVTRECKLGA